MLEILRAGWRELSGNPGRTLALSIGPAVLLALAHGLDLRDPRPDGSAFWGMLASLPVMAWLSANWMAAPGIHDPDAARMPALAVRPLLRSVTLSLLVTLALVVPTLPVILARAYLMVPTEMIAAQSHWPTILVNWLISVAVSVAALWLWLRLATAFEAAATGVAYGLRQAFAATRPQTMAILGVSVILGLGLFIADHAATAPGGRIGIWLQALTTGLNLLLTVVLSRVIARRVAPQSRAEIFA